MFPLPYGRGSTTCLAANGWALNEISVFRRTISDLEIIGSFFIRNRFSEPAACRNADSHAFVIGEDVNAGRSGSIG